MLEESGRPIAVTLERTFTDNQPIITPGVYRCVKRMFNRGGYETFGIMVDGHTDILFHRANLETQLEGCIGIAMSFTLFNDIPGIADAKHGFSKFWDVYGKENEIQLDVANFALIAA